MPYVPEHTPTKVSTRSARESSREKQQQDGQTDRPIHRRIVENHFSRRFEGCTSQIRSYLEVDFLHDANASFDMEVKWLEETVMGHGSIGLLQARSFFW